MPVLVDAVVADRDRVDLRLAIGAAAAWPALAMCLGASVPVIASAAAAGVAVGVGALVWRRHWLRSLGIAGFCVGIVLVPFAARTWLAADAPLELLAEQHASVTLELVTTGDPHTLAATGIAGIPRVAVPADAIRLVGSESGEVSGSVVVLAPAAEWREVLPGQRVRLDGTLEPSLDGAWSGVVLFADRPPHLLGEPPWWQRAAGVVRSGLREAATVLPPAERGLLPGLVDGDTSGIDPVLYERFKVAGLTHLVAVSGLNAQ